MSLSAEERAAVVEFRIEKALRAYEQAQGVIKLKYWETIANRLYYAAYNAVSALLIANGDSAQSHSGVIHLFGQHFIKTGLLSSEMGRLYHKLRCDRPATTMTPMDSRRRTSCPTLNQQEN